LSYLELTTFSLLPVKTNIMKKLLIAVILCSLTFTSAYAGGSKDKKNAPQDKEVKVNIHIDKNGDVHINGRNISDKDIENWVNDHLKNISIVIDDNSGDTASHPDEDKGKTKTVQLSLTIKEK
jgi:biopolymer transport protein ExbD